MSFWGSLSRTLILIAAFGSASLAPSHALPFIDLFKSDLERVPASDELRRQEDEARVKLNKALDYERQGKAGKALDAHKGIVRSYPLTTAAAMSQFKVGELYRAEGKSSKAFDAYQKFIDNYKNSSAFDQAIQSQFEIAQAGQAGEIKQKTFAIIPRKVQSSELLEWYQNIIDNAPYSDYAPLSQFAIAEIYQEQEKPSLAIRTYQAFVDKYPRHEKSPEAQYRIGAIGKKAIDDGSQDVANLRSARGAMEDVIVAYENSARAEEARATIQQFDRVEAAKFYEVAKFYEKQKKYRSAAIYYQKVLSVPESEHFADAQTRLDAVVAKAPNVAEVTPPPTSPAAASGPFSSSNPPNPSNPYTSEGGAPSPVVAANTTPPKPKTLLKARKGYAGPPAPDLKIASTRPKMRTNPAAVPIVPEPPDPDPNTPSGDPAADVDATLSGDDPPLPPDPDEDFLPLPPPPDPEPTEE